MVTPLCPAPFVEGFTNPSGGYRNCCAADPQVSSTKTFVQWWNSQALNEFRQRLMSDQLPAECKSCQLNEEATGHSFRTSLLDQTTNVCKAELPNRWNIIFGNQCNLSCWMCTENASSRIEQDKKQIGIIPVDQLSAEEVFAKSWPDLRKQIIQSYKYHDEVVLTILGGEPLYSPLVLTFLKELIDLKLANKTRLEFHTNATNLTATVKKILSPGNWKFVCMMLSIDAVGKTAEWIRYGCHWPRIVKNIEFYKTTADYVEVHATVSVLNISNLHNLVEFCQDNHLVLKFFVLTTPAYLALENWPGKADDLCSKQKLEQAGLVKYYDMIGKTPSADAPLQLQQYVNQFNSIRNPISMYDAELGVKLGLK